MLEAALGYAARGWPVHPCNPRNKVPLLPNDRDPVTGDKIPKTGGLKKASCDPILIRQWWQRWPKALVGLNTGYLRLFIVDFDPRTDPDTGEVFTLERLKAELENGWVLEDGTAVPGVGPLPISQASVTPSGGVHLWLLWPDDGGPPITNRGCLPLHIDVRGLGGYIVAPPGHMPDYEGLGPRDYVWHRRGEIAQAPAALIERLRTPGKAGGKGSRQARTEVSTGSTRTDGVEAWRPAGDDPVEAARRKWALTALDSRLGELARAVTGERGQTLNRIGFNLGQIVGAGVLSRAMVVAGLESAAVSNGLVGTDGVERVREAIERAVRDGEGQPRDMSDVGALAGRSSGSRDRAPAWDAVPDGPAGPAHGDDLSSPPVDRTPLPPPEAGRPSILPASGTVSGNGRVADPSPAERGAMEAVAAGWLVRARRGVAPASDDAMKKLAFKVGMRASAEWLGGFVALARRWGRRHLAPARVEMLEASFSAGMRKGFDVDALLLHLRCARFPFTDFGIAERFQARFGDQYRFTTAKGWLGWDERRWKVLDQDEKTPPAEIIDAVWRTIRAIQDEARVVEDSGEGGHGLDFAYIKAKQLRWHHQDVAMFGRQSETSGKPASIQLLARRWLTVPIESFDCDPMAVNVLNGTLRFRRETVDGVKRAWVQLEPHDRADLNTRLAPVIYDPAATCTVYDGFIEWAQPVARMRRYLHQWAGYSISGDISEQKLHFWYGLGANGKSTAIDIWAHVAGDYAGTIGIETFLDQGIKKRGEQASPDLARLGGVRLLRASEPERGAKLNEALIKAATGGEPMAVRALHRGFFDLSPLFKLTIGGNYRPDIPGTDEGIWRRMKLIPWEQHRAEDERDEDLPAKLRAEASGVFNHMVRGLIDWLENGLVEPDEVKAATQQYREDSDPLARFLRLCTEPDEAGKVQSSRLYGVFQAWCKVAGEKEWTQKGFSKALLDKGHRKKASDGMQWLGMRLIREAHDFVDAEGRPKEQLDEAGDDPVRGDAGGPAGEVTPSEWDDPDWVPEF